MCIPALMFIAGCDFTGKPRKDVARHPSVVVDSLFVPTGNAKLDSLLQLAATAPQDTNLVKLYYQIAEMYENNDFEKGKEYYLKVKNLSEELDWNRGRWLFARGFPVILCMEGLIDSAIVVNRQMLELAEREKNEKEMNVIAINIGAAYLTKEWYETALEYF